MPSSPDSSSDSSGGGVTAGGAASPQHLAANVAASGTTGNAGAACAPGQGLDGNNAAAAPNLAAEKALPGFKMSQKREWTEFLFKLWDLGATLKNGGFCLFSRRCGVQISS